MKLLEERTKVRRIPQIPKGEPSFASWEEKKPVRTKYSTVQLYCAMPCQRTVPYLNVSCINKSALTQSYVRST